MGESSTGAEMGGGARRASARRFGAVAPSRLMARAAGALLAAALCAPHVTAVAAPVAVRGAASCAQWRTDRAMESFGARLAEMWLLGYLSGLASARGADALRGWPSPAVFADIDAWCLAHPGAAVDDAADALFERRAAPRPAR